MGSSLCLVAALDFGYAAQPAWCMGGGLGGVGFRSGREITVQSAVFVVGEFHPVFELFGHMFWVDMVAVVFLDHTGEKFGDPTGAIGEEAQTFAGQIFV